jgi:peptidoglycan/LPS O-acetylase OafA/YrhL
MKAVYLRNLDGLRFIAALLVLVHHVEQFKLLFGLPNAWSAPWVRIVGRLAVVLFFVLSGYLITYLLLTERAQTGSVGIRSFYVRRILRIWPLYFLIVLTAFFLWPRLGLFALPGIDVLSHPGLYARLPLYLVMVPNLAVLLPPLVPYVSQAWSIGTEEQFYLVWPWLVSRFRNVVPALFAVTFGHMAVTLLLPPRGIAYQFWTNLAIGCMALGGLYAWVAFTRQERITRALFSWPAQVALYVTTIVLVARGVAVPHFTFEMYAVLFGAIILNLAHNERSLVRLEWGPLKYLGRISYGLYMYHPIAIVAALRLLLLVKGAAETVLVDVVALAFTIAFAAASYALFETPFLRLKHVYSRILTGEPAEGSAADPSIESDRPGASPRCSTTQPAGSFAGSDGQALR